jgi:hypothetical protein
MFMAGENGTGFRGKKLACSLRENVGRVGADQLFGIIVHHEILPSFIR